MLKKFVDTVCRQSPTRKPVPGFKSGNFEKINLFFINIFFINIFFKIL